LSNGTLQVTASAQGWTGRTLNVTVVKPILLLSGVVTSRAVNAAADTFNVLACVNTSDCSDAVNAPVTVSVDVGNSQIVQVSPAQADVPNNANSTPVFTLSSPTAAGSYTVTASAPGFTPASTVVTVA